MQLRARTAKAIGLILAFPVLVAYQLALLSLDAPRGLIILFALLAWFVGPVLLVVGVVLLWPRGRWTFLPSTGPGWLALWLLCGFASFFFVFGVVLALQLGPDDPERFFSNLYAAIPLLLAGACAVGAGIVAGYAVFFRHERSLLVVGMLVFGAIVAIFTAGEIGGHEEPGGSNGRRRATPAASPTAVQPSPVATSTPAATPAANSHSNLSVEEVAPGEVRVSFDYAYNHDPGGITITATTVSPLAATGKPLPGYEPVVRPINKGSGHMDVTLTFTAEQLAEVRAFSVCFTAPGEPDLGCAVKEYVP
ncbi:MAG: hypothetical protein IH609_10580 [Dehalococcoidia bacterium]|nr:hypothetical protein [Dehalococcoidia bacterium]